MTDPTPEQHDAWKRLSEWYPSAAKVVAPLLPVALTNPTPELPNEPGLYVDARGIAGPVWRVHSDHTIGQVGGYGKAEDAPPPFTPLVPERPKVTRGQVIDIVGTGTLMSHEIWQLVDLVNGGTE